MGFKARLSPETFELPIRQGVVLRRLAVHDAEELFALIDANRSYLREWLTFLDGVTAPAGLSQFLGDAVAGYENGTSQRFALSVEGAIRGIVSLECILPQPRRAKIGYWQCESMQGKGLVTSAVRELLRYGFEERNLNLIEIRAATENHKSRAVAERLGMSLDGILRQREWLYDHFEDLCSYTLLAQEWRELQ